LFERWIATYPEEYRSGFHRDGIVDESIFESQPFRVLFVLLEPNSRDGLYDRYRGWDLRKVFGEEKLKKELNVNLAIWAQALLDGVTKYVRPSEIAVEKQIRRIALLNLKKFGGSGKADYEAISIHAWKDREFIRKEVRIISPTVVVTCGNSAHRLFGWIMKNDPYSEIPDAVWEQDGFFVLPANHPSLRPKNAEGSSDLLVQRARETRIASFNKAISVRKLRGTE
jgi:Uracil DNA glycosylase superfamily.